ncbi:MAG TPA: hypothetical protein VD906_16505 [Caulobacteraceae bacterium]|nr:hypothetical protein [Caulobacteraceae bacterium]
MRLKLVLSFALAIAATPALAENWKPVAGEPDTYIDTDFTRVDEQTGLVVLRTAMGKPSGAGYDEWTEKEPIMMSAIDCKADTYKDLGLDFENTAALPDGWRGRASQAGAKIGVGAAGVAACKAKATLQTVALP